MPELFIEIRGDQELQRDFSDLPRQNNANLRQNALRSAHIIGAEFLVYPAPPPMSSYTRTNTLSNNVKIIDHGDSFGVSIDPVGPSGVHYGRYVIGYPDGKGQARIHAGRWKLLKDVANKEQAAMLSRVDAQLNNDVRRFA